MTRTPRHDFIFQRRKVFCIIYFAATSFPPCVALFRPPPPNAVAIPPPSLHVACYKPRPLLFESLFSNPFCFRQRCETIEIDRSSISFILQFLLGILYKVVPNKSSRQWWTLSGFLIKKKKKKKEKNERKGNIWFGILEINDLQIYEVSIPETRE